MKTPIAIYNLWHQGVKTMVSVGGVGFALLLVFMQLGFMGAVSKTATNVLERLHFDVLMRAPDYVHLYEPGQIERKWLSVANSTKGVQSVSPFWITIHNWRKMPNQDEPQDRSFESKYLPIAVMAFRPQDSIFDIPSVESQLSSLYRDNALIIDDSTQADYGPWNGKRFSMEDIEHRRRTEIGGRDFGINGLYKLGTGLASNGAVIMGHEGFARISPWSIHETTSMGLIRVQDNSPEAIADVVERLRDRTRAGLREVELPPEPTGFMPTVQGWFGKDSQSAAIGVVDVMSREEALEREKYRWIWQTPIGLIFQLGVALSLIVGAAIVYMVLSTDVANRLPEYATLLAMGYSRKYLASIVMTQAIVLCAFGFLASWAIAEVLYRVTYAVSNIPMEMNAPRVVLVSLLGLLMCCISGMLALRKLWKAEPANLF